MKKLALLLALIMVAAACVLPVSADEPVFVKVFDFDTVTHTTVFKAGLPTPELDTENQIDGTGCNSITISKQMVQMEAKFDAVDLSKCDYLAFWLYLSDASLATKFTSGRIELNHTGATGNATWTAYPTGAAAYPDTNIANMIQGGAKDGWNLVVLPLNATKVAGEDKADMTRINYFRLYSLDEANKPENTTIKLDNMYAYSEGATIPEPKKAGEEPTTPDEPVTPPEQKFVKILSFDEAYFGSLDTENHLDGTGCASYTIPDQAGPAVFQKKFDTPVDLTGCKYVEFWLYLSDASQVTNFRDGQIELTSSGGCDVEERGWNIGGNGLKDLIVGEPKDGWNLVRLDISNPGGADFSRINFFRMFGYSDNKLTGLTIKFDDMYAYTEGANVPAPEKIAAQTDAPATDAPTEPVVGPTTFDAASSIAVVAVAAMGVVLVASGKRH